MHIYWNNQNYIQPPQCHSNPGEVQIATRQLSSGKAPGSVTIPVEISKEDGSALMSKFQLIWVKEQLPQDSKDASIIYIYKRKGNWQACDNHGGISLLSISGKILARVLLNCLNNHLEHGLLPKSQCSFCKERGTVDVVFAVREMSGTEYWPLLNLYWSDQGIWHGHQRWLLENHGKKFHHHRLTISWWHTFRVARQRRKLRSLSRHKWD